jgi:hypothetical protein
MAKMSPQDQSLLALARSNPDSVAGAAAVMQAIDDLLPETDGLKWFNWLYLQVTTAVQAKIAQGGFYDPAWLEKLDVEFALLYFKALDSWLSTQAAPGSWRALFERRADPALARIQFALAGTNAHINHDLPLAIVKTCELSSISPTHEQAEYRDYTALNPTLDALIESAKSTLHVRLAGDALPEVSHLEDTIAAWNVSAAREAAWINAEALWAIRDASGLSERYQDMLDGMTTVASKALLAVVP